MNDHPMPVAVRPDTDSEHRSDAHRQLEHLFRHALKEEQVNPLFFLLQRFRAKAQEGGGP